MPADADSPAARSRRNSSAFEQTAGMLGCTDPRTRYPATRHLAEGSWLISKISCELRPLLPTKLYCCAKVKYQRLIRKEESCAVTIGVPSEPKGRDMSLKLKALGLSVIAAMAGSSVAVMNASANTSGHFVSEINNLTHVTGFEGPGTAHRLHLTNHGLSGQVGCDTVSYEASIIAGTVNSVTAQPSYANCYTTTVNKPTVIVHVNGCTYTFRSAAGGTSNTEQTAHLVCEVGKKVEITYPNCTTSVHPQTVNTGITYTRVIENGKHAVTLDSNAQLSATRHGACQHIAPTNGIYTLIGSATAKGFNGVGGPQVSVTVT
jgi:hypothetical protein